jgi:hypothetical protein
VEKNLNKRTYPSLLTKGLKFIKDFLDYWIDDYVGNEKRYLHINSAMPVLQFTMNDGHNYWEHKRSVFLNTDDAFLSSQIYKDYYHHEETNDISNEDSDDKKDHHEETNDISNEDSDDKKDDGTVTDSEEDVVDVSEGSDNDMFSVSDHNDTEMTSTPKKAIENSLSATHSDKVENLPQPSESNERESLIIATDSKPTELSVRTNQEVNLPQPSESNKRESLSIVTDSIHKETSVRTNQEVNLSQPSASNVREPLSIATDSIPNKPCVRTNQEVNLSQPSASKKRESLSIATDRVIKEPSKLKFRRNNNSINKSLVPQKKQIETKEKKKNESSTKKSSSKQSSLSKTLFQEPVTKNTLPIEKRKKKLLPTNSLASSFMTQRLQNTGRDKVLSTDETMKLGTMSNPPGTNQCYSIAVFQLLLGMNKLWFYVESSLKGYSNLQVDDVVAEKPFIIASHIMGSLLRTSMLNAKAGCLPKPCKVDILRQLRERFLSSHFTANKQEDAHEFLTYFLDKLESECPNTKLSCSAEECRKRKCTKCDHESDTIIESTCNILLPINEKTWSTGQKSSIQTLLEESYDGREIPSGSLCPKCNEGGTQVLMLERAVLKSSSPELLIVVKRMNVLNGTNMSNKLLIECDCVLRMPDMYSFDEERNNGLDTKKNSSQSYYLRSVVCHHGSSYESGHYYTMIIGRDEKSGSDQYFELNDNNHFSLSKERFFETIAVHGYIFHFSKSPPGDLLENYKGFSTKSEYISKLSTTCQQAWRKKPPVRGDNRRISNNEFIYKGKKKGMLTKDFYSWGQTSLKENSPTCSQCLCFNGIMCFDWDTFCTNCISVFPTEMKASELCSVESSTQYDGHGLFSKRLIEEGEFICRMIGKQVAKGTKGQYVVHIESDLIIDASHSLCIAKYANHSCNPNCILQKLSRIESRGSAKYIPEVWISAAESIPKGVELTYNYGTSFVFDPCKCDVCQSKMT